MPNLYTFGLIGLFLLGVGYIAYRNIKENAKLKAELEDKQRYVEAMQKAKRNADKSNGSSDAAIDKRLSKYDR